MFLTTARLMSLSNYTKYRKQTMKTNIDLYFSGCGNFCGTRDDLRPDEWEHLTDEDNLIIYEGTPRDEAFNKATALGHDPGEAWELITNCCEGDRRPTGIISPGYYLLNEPVIARFDDPALDQILASIPLRWLYVFEIQVNDTDIDLAGLYVDKPNNPETQMTLTKPLAFHVNDINWELA